MLLEGTVPLFLTKQFSSDIVSALPLSISNQLNECGLVTSDQGTNCLLICLRDLAFREGGFRRHLSSQGEGDVTTVITLVLQYLVEGIFYGLLEVLVIIR